MKRPLFTSLLLAFLLISPMSFAAEPTPATPKNNPGDWVRANDYPAAALVKQQEGVVRFLLSIGADGVPTECKVTLTSGVEALDQQTCQILMARARFEPARDKEGKPTTATYLNSVRWSIPTTEEVNKIEPTTQIMSFVVDVEGKPKDCTVSFKSGLRESNKQRGGPCLTLPARYEPFVDGKGRPVARRVKFISRVEISDAGN